MSISIFDELNSDGGYCKIQSVSQGNMVICDHGSCPQGGFPMCLRWGGTGADGAQRAT